jgi:calcium binding protein 39
VFHRGWGRILIVRGRKFEAVSLSRGYRLPPPAMDTFARAAAASPTELVQAACEATAALEADPAAAVPAISRTLTEIKLELYSTAEVPTEQHVGVALACAVLQSTLLPQLLAKFPALEFECRKDVVQVFSNLLRKHLGQGELSAIDWLERSPGVLLGMMRSYQQPDVALNFGMMLREAVRHERLALILLQDEETLPTLFRCFESVHFDVASDAFATCRDLLTRHKGMVASFLSANYVRFVRLYLQLVVSTNYVTRRQSLKLLSELLLDRSNFAVMTRFIAEPEHLKTTMVLLRDRSASIQCGPNCLPRALRVLLASSRVPNESAQPYMPLTPATRLAIRFAGTRLSTSLRFSWLIRARSLLCLSCCSGTVIGLSRSWPAS